VGGILVILAIFAAAIGVLAIRRLAYGMAGLGLFILIGVIAALTRPHAGISDVVPTLAGGIAAALALRRLARLATPVPALATPSDTALALDTALRTGEPPDLDHEPLPDLPDEWQQPVPEGQPSGGGRVAAGRVAAGRVAASRPPGGTAASPADPRRRSFLTASAVIAGGAVVAGVGGNLLAELGNVSAARTALRIPRPALPAPPLPPGVDLKIPGLSPFITPNGQFYRVDTAIVLPEITPASWKLRIHGMVARELTLTFDDLIKRPLLENYVTLACVSNPVAGPYIGNAKWLGASLRSLLQEAGIRSGAEQLLCTSADGFSSGTPVTVSMDGRDAMLAVAMNGTALPVEHGFPVRLVVPGLYGYVSACKWITDIEVTTYAASSAYWAVRGWDQQAPVKTESRIDVPLAANLAAGTHPVAGVAWAQHKGIDAVEVRVDRGPWQEARLATVPGIDTWRQWVWNWDATPGSHLIESRATDATGYTQTALQEPPEPNGATGYPQAQVTVT
ncbi:MAG: molybdopterin-dependent oxidoreductase, partial [Streptosporangiaceae bacterium]